MSEKQISNKCEIQNIEPFSDIWYKDCFHSSLFPIINYYAGTIKPFILKEVFLYNYENSDGLPILKSVSKEIIEGRTLYDLLDEMGIRCRAKVVSNNLIEDLCEALSNHNPVIVGVDCFYESLRMDAYNREHIAHSLLIYGFDKEEKMFNIMEHNFRFSIEFARKTISYFDITNSYNGFLANLGDKTFTNNRLPTFCEIDKVFPSFYRFDANTWQGFNEKVIDESTYVNKYIKFILDNQEVFQDSLRNIERFKDDLIHMISTDVLLSHNAEIFFDSINTIINNKKIEKFVFTRVFKALPEILSCLDKIIDSWSAIRGLLAKYTYTKVYNQKRMDTCAEHMNSIYESEIKYSNLTISFYKHYQNISY